MVYRQCVQFWASDWIKKQTMLTKKINNITFISIMYSHTNTWMCDSWYRYLTGWFRLSIFVHRMISCGYSRSVMILYWISSWFGRAIHVHAQIIFRNKAYGYLISEMVCANISSDWSYFIGWPVDYVNQNYM